MLSAARAAGRSKVPTSSSASSRPTAGRKPRPCSKDWSDSRSRTIPYRDKVLKEFDIDGALARKPALILIDELAHSNVPGSRHPKRWQDVEELLAAGIDVYSTINVQHLETLNDVVGGITGIRVWETVPDQVFDAADEVVLVDLSAGRAAAAAEGRQGLSAPPGRTRDPELLPQGQPDRAARTGVAPHRRPRRQPDAQVPARPVGLAGLADAGVAAGLHRPRRRGRPHRPQRRAHRRASGCALACACTSKRRHCSACPSASASASSRASSWRRRWGPRPQRCPAAMPSRRSSSTRAITTFPRSIVGRDHVRAWRPWYRSFADRVGKRAPDLDVIQVARDEAAWQQAERRANRRVVA